VADIYWTETATEQLQAALSNIERYFIEKEAIGLAAGQADQFLAELNGKISLIKELPKLYPVRLDFTFRGKEYRSFVAHWFTVFYRYLEEQDTVEILFIRSSVSDFSDLKYFT